MIPLEFLQVAPDDRRLYELETKVACVTPSLLRPGSPKDFVDFLGENGQADTYLWQDSRAHALGYLALSELTQSEKLEIRSIAVVPDFHGLGIGTTIMLYAEEEAKQRNIKNLLLATSPENIKALKFYKKLGYTITDTVENYYGDGTPRFILEKVLK